VDKWRVQPIGGEVRPEVWSCLFDDPSCAPEGQDFERCVAVTHVSWLCNEGVFRGKVSGAARERALRAAQRLGYEFHVATAGVRFEAGRLDMALTVTNTGVAPFYYDWPLELGVLDARGEVVARWDPGWRLTGILPGDAAREWRHSGSVGRLAAGNYGVAVRVPNPLPRGEPVRFANEDQDRDRPGWLTVGRVIVR
jgi:hypothetical protein